jgi:hypothetical protein
MPHYDFRFMNGNLVQSDDHGLELPDDEAARTEAEFTAWDLQDISGEDWSGWIIEVTDELGRRVVLLPIKHG